MPSTDDRMREILVSDEAYATTLVTILIDKYGTECFDWLPEVIRQQINQDMSIQIPDENFDKLMAAIHILTSDGFRQDEKQFVDIANALCGDGFRPDVFDPASVAECAWAVVESSLLDPFDGPDSFCPAIRAYIGQALSDEGFLSAPSILVGLADFTPTATQDFTEDLDMYEAVYKTQQSKTEAVMEALEQNTRGLFLQLESLKLENGSTEGLVVKAAELLRAMSSR